MSNTPPPATVWSGSQQEEYSSTTANNIADSSGNTLVDASGNLVVDNGVTVTPLPTTVWSEDDTK